MNNIKTVKYLKQICGIFFILIILSSCASKKIEASGLRPVYVTNSKKVNLLNPSKACIVFEGLQALNGSFGSQSFTLLSYTQIDAKGINLSLMNDFGTDMGNLFYDGSKVIFDSAYFPKALPGEYIICDIQNAYYDKDELRKNFEAAGLKFEVSVAENEVEIRKIFDGKNLIEEISISQNEVKIQNFLRGYSYQLVNAEDF